MKRMIELCGTWGITLGVAAAFWGVLFPQYLFGTDCIVEEEQKEEEDFYIDLGNVSWDNIQWKCSILEWIGEKNE